MILLFLPLLLFVIILVIIKLYLTNYVKTDEHPYSKLPYNEKKKIIREKFALIQSKKIKLSKKHNSFFKQTSRNNTNTNLDLNFFTEVIDIDVENRTIHVEGLITYDKLLDYTLQFGLIPKIVPELKFLTVGGTISGLGLESSSFKYGLVPAMVYEFEILTGAGDIITANKEKNKDLFDGFPNSYGSLGYILSAKLELIKAKPYVHIKNKLYTNIDNFIEDIKKCMDINANNIDFLDGIILSKNELYLMTGKMIDEKPKCLNKYVYSIYYETIGKKEDDYMTIKDYFWRYDTNGFYLKGITNNKWLRYYLGELLNTHKLKKINEMPIVNTLLKKKEEEQITNDLMIQLTDFGEFLNWYDENINVYPVWICPSTSNKEYTFYKSKSKYEIDFGIGFGPKKINKTNDQNYYKKQIDNKIYKMKTMKGLYADTFLSETEFMELYDPFNKYNQLKKKYDPNDRFYTLYKKIIKNQ